MQSRPLSRSFGTGRQGPLGQLNKYVQKEETRYNKDLIMQTTERFIYFTSRSFFIQRVSTLQFTLLFYHYKPWFTEHVHSSKHIHSGLLESEISLSCLVRL